MKSDDKIRNRDGPYERLAAAIVYQAYRDLKKAADRYIKYGDNEKNDKEIRQSLDFFDSEFYDLLTDISPEAIIRRTIYESTGRKRKNEVCKKI